VHAENHTVPEELPDPSEQQEQPGKLNSKEMVSAFALFEITGGKDGHPADYVLLDINETFEQITGIKAGESKGRTVKELFPELDPGWLANFNKMALAGDSKSTEIYSQNLNKFFEANAFLLQEGKVVVAFNDVTSRKMAEDILSESEAYLSSMMDTMHAGILVIDPTDGRIMDANRYAENLIGAAKADLIGRRGEIYLRESVAEATAHQLPSSLEQLKQGHAKEARLYNIRGQCRPVLNTSAAIQRWGQGFWIKSFVDISPMKQLLKEQELDISTARVILDLVNQGFPLLVDLDNGYDMVVYIKAIPCNQEGGDHFMVRTIPAGSQNPRAKTVLSLKDQSGHKVGCILRSIITDLLHQSILDGAPGQCLEETIARLNSRIADRSGFADKDFVTAFNAELDHSTMTMRFVLCGHGQFLLVRGGQAQLLPSQQETRLHNLPLNVAPDQCFVAGELKLHQNDMVLAVTDGLCEAAVSGEKGRNIGSMQTVRSLVEELVNNGKGRNLRELTDGLLLRVSGLGGREVNISGLNESYDDITVMGIEFQQQDLYSTRMIKVQNTEDLQRHINETVAFHSELWQKHGFGQPLRLRLALSEAMVNAYKHGNQQDPGKSIQIRHHYGTYCLLDIRDQGDGFDHKSAGESCFCHSVTRPCGRGLLIIKRMADSVAWNEKGNRIAMVFDKNPIDTI
jgi:PAS domain S-box-containing protein